jgi:DNA (cytosine-5)-methyltransferase 1
MLNVLDLFAGIGGFSLGLERTGGFKTVAFCEIDAKARLVLKKNFPCVPIFNDVKELNVETLRSLGCSVDVITGGFPCQDISLAGGGAGLEGARSGLWFELCRLIKEIQPKYAIIENVSALRSRGLDQVLRSLFEIGYDAEWHCIPASSVGAPHQRDRIWIVAYPSSKRKLQPEGVEQDQWRRASNSGTPLAYPMRSRSSVGLSKERYREEGYTEVSYDLSDRLARWEGGSVWAIEPGMGRVADGVLGRVDRLRQLGNAVVPQIPELIGRSILTLEEVMYEASIRY